MRKCSAVQKKGILKEKQKSYYIIVNNALVNMCFVDMCVIYICVCVCVCVFIEETGLKKVGEN